MKMEAEIGDKFPNMDGGHEHIPTPLDAYRYLYLSS